MNKRRRALIACIVLWIIAVVVVSGILAVFGASGIGYTTANDYVEKEEFTYVSDNLKQE